MDRHYRLRLAFGTLGAAVAWLVHLLAIYAVAEWRCASLQPQPDFLGVITTAWIVIGISIPLILLSLASTRCALHISRQMEFLGRLGAWLGVIFTVIIVIESVPALFFLRSCQ